MLRLICLLWLLGVGCVPMALSQESTLPLIENVGIDEQLGNTVDLHLSFTDQSGERVQLKDFFVDERPVIIAPVYYSCPNLCTLVLNGVRNLINGLDLELGRDYQLLAVSFDPENTPALAAQKADNYYQTLEKPESGRLGWQFLTGNPAEIDTLMETIGFRYKKVGDQYSHTSAIMLFSPKGKLTRYVYGVDYPAKDVRLALVEASQGKIGTTLDKLLIYCFRYDPQAGKYVPYAYNLMRAGGVATLLAMALAGFFLWKKELSNRRRL